MTNPHSREQLKNEVVSILALEFMAGSSEIVGLTKQLMDVFDPYTAEQSLLRAKDTLDKVYELSPTAQFKDWKPQDAVAFYERLKAFEKQLDKEIKASRLDAEGGEK